MRRLSVVLAGLLVLLVAGSLLPRLPRVADTPVAHGKSEPLAQRGTTQAQAAPLSIGARATETGVVFELNGVAPSTATEAILWYDTEQGHQAQRFAVQPNETLQHSVAVSFKQEGLVVPMPFSGRLDYWWALRDGKGSVIWREADALFLPLRLRALAGAPEPTLPRPFAWSEASSEHYLFRFYPGSAAARDIEQIKRSAEQALVHDSAIIPATEAISITVYLVPRIFWQGGVAYDGSTLMISYTDRNYAGVGAELYLQHETVHALAHGLVKEGGDIGGLIGEGLATYVPGGHYGPEPIDAWTAALRRNGRFVPLCRLRVTFFEQQHEIAYLEGASFVGYLIRTFGLPAFRTFYADEPAIPEDAAQDVDGFCAREATRTTAGTGKTYAELEAGWMSFLDEQDPSTTEQAGIEGQLRFFDLMRHYQEVRDPDARILPQSPRRWDATLQRAFATPALTETNALYETLFIATDRALDGGDPATANALMDELDIAISTGVFTGTTGRQVAEIGSLLRRTARDYRLGARNDPSPARRGALDSSPLWTDYRLVLNSVELEPKGAHVRVERLTRALGGPERREGLIMTLAHGVFDWRITSVTLDPQRPAITPAPVRREPLRIAVSEGNRLMSTTIKRWEQIFG